MRGMFKIIKGGDIVAPEKIGARDILICGGLIAAIGEGLDIGSLAGECEVIDADGLTVIPGCIDGHVHIIGGGGEAGYATRTPEVMLGDVVACGITTVIGVLGTDGVTRHLESLLAKARGLEEEGISTFIYTGSYEIPTVSFTKSVHKDMALIDKVIGCGEIAVSDHRSSCPSREELARLAAQCRIGGMLSGKAGVLHLHMGDGHAGLAPIIDLAETTDIPIRQFYPTHVNRNESLLEDAIRFAKMGGVIDMTSCISKAAGVKRAIDCSSAVRACVDRGVPLENITMSSDGNGSMSILDDDGKPAGLLVARLDSLCGELSALVDREGFELSEAVKIVTSNVADYLKLRGKGRVAEGFCADLVLLGKKREIVHVFAKGRQMVKNSVTVAKGVFES
ncbi:MAG: beta-aspartyl-peptidase [Synergistaceae bacterium]|jgi:beta-aspartyl-dipeptidase (metallo-type)|nr:beta-aspartyl-peptidase [Synergistaceae bacterium]